MFRRTIQSLVEKRLFKGKAIIIYGARRVGKTTLIQELQKKFSTNETLYLNCDEPDVRMILQDVTSTQLKDLMGRRRIVLIDEAQRVRNIGITLKLLIDNLPDRQFIATGSSALDLSNEIVEPLTGRKYEFQLFPFSLEEISQEYSRVEIDRLLERRLIFGMYPEIVTKTDEAEVLLKELSGSYLYRDILQYQNLKRAELLEKLLLALALQVGNEVSYSELAELLSVNRETITNYIDLLEKGFVIFRLAPFSRNLRNELKKLRKIYFYDNGIRNALINNFNMPQYRQDIGSLWENFMIVERRKHNLNHGKTVNAYFWRTHQRQEIDYLEERQGQLAGFEIKWKPQRRRAPRVFLDAYPNSTVEFVDRQSYASFAGLGALE